MRPTFRLAAWNLRHGGGNERTPAQAIALRSLDPDVVVLSEFRAARGGQVGAVLADGGLPHSAVAPGGDRQNRVAVFSRAPLAVVSDAGPRLLHARIDAGATPFSLLAVHIPDESSPTLRAGLWQATASFAREHARAPAIIAGDFNTSRRGADPSRPGQTCERWLGAVESSGFRDAWRLCGAAGTTPSWFGPRGERARIDMAYASESLRKTVAKCWYDASCVEAGLSDHAVLVLELLADRVEKPSQTPGFGCLFSGAPCAGGEETVQPD
ncbi:MAG TPA: endonuclease/exonuclease/phosphatase family protein [Phycisphaerales bacterium]|nr:endonuclease/exonuclease/phosphatase family protein [Phycisphaerales bacterium]